MPIWRVAVAAILIVAFAITAADVSPASASGKVYRVPWRIDATGSRDVSRELNSFIASVPNGSIIRFRAGGTYRLGSGGIVLSGRRDLVLNGNGARLKSSGCQTDAQPIKLRDGTSGTTIRGFILAGDNPAAGSRRAHRGRCESQAGVGIYGSFDTTIQDVVIRRTNGDCVYVSEGHAGTRVWSRGLTFRDSVCRKNGRMGVAIVGGKDIVVTRVRFDRIAMYVLDIEPNRSTGGGANVRFRNNKVGTYTIDDDWHPYFFAANGAAGDDNIRDVKVTRNRVTGGTLRSVANVRTRRGIVFTNNVSTVPASGPVLFFEHVRGLTISGNVQPLRSGQLASIRNSSSVTYQP